MSSGEEDYMSDKFLSESTKDIRPGLIKNRARQHEVQVEAKKARIVQEQKSNRNKFSEKERLKEGLNIAISTENKGFALLAKMGYKVGEGLGKTASGIVEPILVSVKSNRAGLGRETALEELKEKRKEILRKRLLAKDKGQEVSVEEFRRRKVQEAEERFTEVSLRKCQKTCERLDQDSGIDKPELLWFWPIREKPDDDENTEERLPSPKNDDNEKEASEDKDVEEEIQYETAEKLDMLCSYLRTTYNYCNWCGTRYDNSKDFTENCPGPTKDDH